MFFKFNKDSVFVFRKYKFIEKKSIVISESIKLLKVIDESKISRKNL